MLIKVHKSYRNIVAVCDSNLVGRYFEEGIRILDIKESFFSGDDVDEEELIQLLKDYAAEDATFNIVGENAVRCALKAGIISQEGIARVQDVPFALVLM